MVPAMLAASIVVAITFAAPPSLIGPGPHADADGGSAGDEQPAPAEDERRAAAKQAFDEGLQAVADEEFTAAVDAFERAYELRPHPVTLFNLALALEKAERLPEAWELFDTVVELVDSDAERRDIRRHMRAIEPQIAIVEIDANPRRRMCIDGFTMPAGQTSDFRLAVAPGTHDFILDDQHFSVDFQAGDRRVLLLDDVDEIVNGRRRGPLMPTMMGLTIGTGALAFGLGVGSAAAREPATKTGLAVGAGVSAGIAVGAGIVTLLLDRRVIPDPAANRRHRGPACPGSPELEDRLDRRLSPAIERPAEFALDFEPKLPVPERQLAEQRSTPDDFPRPQGIAAPRSQPRAEAAKIFPTR